PPAPPARGAPTHPVRPEGGGAQANKPPRPRTLTHPPTRLSPPYRDDEATVAASFHNLSFCDSRHAVAALRCGIACSPRAPQAPARVQSIASTPLDLKISRMRPA